VTQGFHDFTHLEAPQPSRWDKGDGSAAVGVLDTALERAGLPGRLAAPKRLLARSEEILEQAREAKARAGDQLAEANRRLLAGDPLDSGDYAGTLLAVGAWLDEEGGRAGSAMAGLWHVAAQIRSNAVAQVFSLTPSLYAELSKVCRGIVAECAAVPALPREVWSATSGGEAAALAVRAGRETDWAQLVRIGDRWDRCHEGAGLLRETGVLTGQLMFDGPVSICTQFKNWPLAMEGLPAARRLPGALRLRRAIDANWLPGLWLSTDAAVTEPTRPQVSVSQVAVAREFA
jgi:hypothetical protein